MRRLFLAALLISCAACKNLEPAITDPAALARGGEGFTANCMRCHDPPKLGAPDREALAQMTPAYILSQLNSGKMQMMGVDLSHQQAREIAAYLGYKP